MVRLGDHALRLEDLRQRMAGLDLGAAGAKSMLEDEEQSTTTKKYYRVKTTRSDKNNKNISSVELVKRSQMSISSGNPPSRRKHPSVKRKTAVNFDRAENGQTHICVFLHRKGAKGPACSQDF